MEITRFPMVFLWFSYGFPSPGATAPAHRAHQDLLIALSRDLRHSHGSSRQRGHGAVAVPDPRPESHGFFPTKSGGFSEKLWFSMVFPPNLGFFSHNFPTIDFPDQLTNSNVFFEKWRDLRGMSMGLSGRVTRISDFHGIFCEMKMRCSWDFMVTKGIKKMDKIPSNIGV